MNTKGTFTDAPQCESLWTIDEANRLGCEMTYLADVQKARGAFFTPMKISQFILDWAIRGAADRVLEPSCGDAAFLLPAAARLDKLGVPGRQLAGRLHGIDIHAPSVGDAAARLREKGHSATITCSDFFDVEPEPFYDAVIGNPPFIRYQDFSGPARAKSLRAALVQGVRLTSLASSWAAFTVHASQFLNDKGRLGFVLPAELLAVNYAAEVRRFLLSRFSKVRLVLFEHLVFPGVQEEIVLLLAEGRGSASCFEVYQAHNLSDLDGIDTTSWQAFSPQHGEKWTSALLPSTALATYRRVTREGKGFCKLIDWADTYLGSVTGDNKFFTLTTAEVAEHGLQDKDLLPISPPGARHLRGLTFTKKAWSQLAREGARCYLFYPGNGRPSAAATRYIARGEKLNVHKAYKCQNRNPWWRVPLPDVPDFIFTYMNHDRPRLTANDAGIYALNSVYGVKLHSDLHNAGLKSLPIACLNSATVLGSEIVGRAYGGGLLKHEPKEADMLPVPAPETIRAVEKDLQLLRPQLDGSLRSGNLTSAMAAVDEVILSGHLGLSDADIMELRQARELFFNRRMTRARGNRGKD